ncbi:MAG: GNAT family N-acetyltransferase [Rhodobacteraceae bacterium]|nr:GNAT family N-acetyltransferase [Paracoccaceae bacterium]
MTPGELLAAVEGTWPPARTFREGPWRMRDGRGGGQRVSAATAEAPVGPGDLAAMEAAQAALGQPALVMVRPGEAALDALLGRAGYRVKDPVVAYAAPARTLARPLPPATAVPHWPPLAMTCDLWAEGGIGPARVAVMHRAPGPKTALIARADDAPAGAAFVAIHAGTAMIHAIEVPPRRRRRGAGRAMIAAAANWALSHGAETVALVVTEANGPARALYASLGMAAVGSYHYRLKD